jgi:hypothetical protein
MTDYVPLIARATAGLDQNTGASRHALYERARTELIGQLRNVDPPLTESAIMRERLALEEAIRKVEADAARRPYALEEALPKRAGLPRRVAIAGLIGFCVIAVTGVTYWQRDTLRKIFAGKQAGEVQREVPKPRPKIADRADQLGQQATAVLYENDPDAQGERKRYVGSVIWRTETVTSGPGRPAELAIKAELNIPERRLGMTLSMQRNTDKALPATHTIEIMFNLPADFPFGGISNVTGILMNQTEQIDGSPLAAITAKVTSSFFLVGLSSNEADSQRNLELLKERSWFNIPIVYDNGRRAILVVEKGTPGERVFKEALAAWAE